MNLKVSQQCTVTIVAEDKFGNPTGAFDSAPEWTVADPTLATVTVADDGLTATVKPLGKLGECQVQVLGKADGKSLAGNLDVVFIAGDAAQVVLQPAAAVDAPDEQPAPDAPAAQ